MKFWRRIRKALSLIARIEIAFLESKLLRDRIGEASNLGEGYTLTPSEVSFVNHLITEIGKKIR